MKYAHMSADGTTVENIIIAPNGLTTWAGKTIVPYDDRPSAQPLQIGDKLVDAKTATFARPPVDQQKLVDAKTAALAHVDTVNAKLQAIADGSLKAQIAAATDPDTVAALKADVAAVDASLAVPAVLKAKKA